MCVCVCVWLCVDGLGTCVCVRVCVLMGWFCVCACVCGCVRYMCVCGRGCVCVGMCMFVYVCVDGFIMWDIMCQSVDG